MNLFLMPTAWLPKKMAMASSSMCSKVISHGQKDGAGMAANGEILKRRIGLQRETTFLSAHYPKQTHYSHEHT